MRSVFLTPKKNKGYSEAVMIFVTLRRPKSASCSCSAFNSEDSGNFTQPGPPPSSRKGLMPALSPGTPCFPFIHRDSLQNASNHILKTHLCMFPRQRHTHKKANVFQSHLPGSLALVDT